MQATSDMIKIFKPPDEEALAWKACVINISNVRMIVCLDFQSDIKQHKACSEDHITLAWIAWVENLSFNFRDAVPDKYDDDK